MKIEKKCWPEYFEKVRTGEKKFEVRLADFEVKTGDVLVLREWDPRKKEYTGRFLEKKVGHILKTKDLTFWSESDIEKYGILVMELE